MASLLIARLKACCTNDPALESLFARLIFDRRLTAKVLHIVGTLHPHYSPHDDAHATRILLNIESMLGAHRIAQLSAVDTWLLLEAAYLHPIAMLASDIGKHADWDDAALRKFVRAQAGQASADEGDIVEELLNSPLDGVYARHDHPYERIGLRFPQNALIPPRLFFVLGEICRMHGRDREDLMALRKVENGLGGDQIHPRLIAGMLRIGDLLDLDYHRFCPVMQAVVGNTSGTAHAHGDKHRAIRHVYIDCQRIEVKAVCAIREDYLDMEKWLVYVRDEIEWQMKRWASIAPHDQFGFLPSPDDITVELEGYEPAADGSQPRFELDQARVLALLNGAGSHRSARIILRELLQNAVDATLLLIWLTHGTGEAGELSPDETIAPSDDPYGEKIARIFSRYPVCIVVEKTAPLTLGGQAGVRIDIVDRGVGIGRDDVSSMTKVGASFRTSWKCEAYDRMPVWMRPSGAFGIGLQSAFNLTEKLVYKTKSVRMGSVLEITMASPTGAGQGAIYLRCDPRAAVARRTGTTLVFYMKKDAERLFDEAASSHARHAPLPERNIDYFAGLFDQLPLPVYVNGVRQARKRDSVVWHYHAQREIAVAIDVGNGEPALLLYFKGQLLHEHRNEWVLPCTVLVELFGEAEATVTVDRSRLRDDALLERIGAAIVATARKLTKASDSVRDQSILSGLLSALGASGSDT